MVKLPELQQLDSQPISVIGMGTMGRRLATKFSARGAEVRGYDSNARVAEEGAAYARDMVETFPGPFPAELPVESS